MKIFLTLVVAVVAVVAVVVAVAVAAVVAVAVAAVAASIVVVILLFLLLTPPPPPPFLRYDEHQKEVKAAGKEKASMATVKAEVAKKVTHEEAALERIRARLHEVGR